jgi:hypothetical protein
MTCSRTHVSRVGARWTLRLGIVLLGWATAWGQTPTPEVVPADDIASANDDHHTTATRLRVITDPTVIARRVWLETEWDKYEGGTHGVEETLGAVWGWRVSTNQDWAVRLKLPYEWRMTGGPGSAVDKDGFGDLKLATGTALRLSRSWRAAASLELRMPTAADGLGGRDWRLQEFGAIAWDLTRSLSLSPSFEYNQSIAEVDNAHPQNYLELFFPATFVLPHHWSVTPRYEAKVDFERENRVIQSVRLQFAKQLSHPPIGFVLAIKKPFYADALDPGRKEFQLNFMVTYFFR